MKLEAVLDRLAALYGEPGLSPPQDPYDMLVATNCGYPASDAACAKGLAALKARFGSSPEAIIDADESVLAETMRAGGIVPELRAARLKTIAHAVQAEYGGNLRAALVRAPEVKAKAALKRFPTIGDPGAEKILLFCRIAPAAAVPSTALHVLFRLGFGEEAKGYAQTYRSVQAALAAEIPETFEARLRAWLLIRAHGQGLCRAKAPRCGECPLAADCRFAAER